MEELPEALYRAEQVRELDRRTIERGVAGLELMERAGRAAYRDLRGRWPGASRIGVLCGGGNNAGDGYIVARLARRDGLQVRLVALVEPDRLKGDAGAAARAYREAGGSVEQGPAVLDGCDMLVDALLGTGLDRPVEGRFATAIETLNGLGAPVMAVDIPSGLHADTGRVMGVAVRAELTPTFIGLKPGLFTGEGPECAGEVRFHRLDAPDDAYRGVAPLARRLAPGLLGELLPPRPRTAHKGRHGHVLVVGGDLGMGGAARMAAEAAGRVGAGLVSVATRAEHLAAVLAARPELMCRGVESADDLDSLLGRAGVVVLGPGIGTGVWGKRLWERAIAFGGPLVLDADGLNLLAAHPRRRDDWILTPHPGEAARLLDCPAAEVQADRFAAASALAARYGGVAVLKGAGTLVAWGDHIRLCDRGNPGMASGGMGDVLSGVLGGLLAQGLSPADAAQAGVLAHSLAADRAAADGERGLLATDLLPFLRVLVNPR